MIEYYKRLNKGEKLKKVKSFSVGCWINIIDPSNDEVKFLVEKFKLEEDLIYDGLDIYEVPRIEEENKKSYFFISFPTSMIKNDYVSSFLIILSKNYFMTISKFKLEIFEKFSDSKKNLLTNKITTTLLKIFFFLSNSYNDKIRGILKNVKQNRNRIKRLKEKDVLDLVLQEEILNDYLSNLSSLDPLYRALFKLRLIKFEENEKEFIEDLLIDLNQTINSCKITLKTIKNMRDYYQTTLSNNLNKILSVLTIFTVFLTIPAVLSGIYGMNIQLPFQNINGIFWILIGFIFCIWTIAVVFLKKLKIL